MTTKYTATNIVDAKKPVKTSFEAIFERGIRRDTYL